MFLKDFEICRIANYDPLNPEADYAGYTHEYVAKNAWGSSVAFGKTHKACKEDLKRYIQVNKRS